MQIKNTVTALAALSAGTAMASAHNHHRHQHQHEAKRAVGDWVYAVIDGVSVSWINEYGGEATATATATTDAAAVTPAAANVKVAAAEVTSAASSAETTATSTSSDDSTGTYITDGFGATTAPTQMQDGVIGYVGNVGNPWGSNIILVDEDVADSYKYTVKFVGNNTEDWFVAVWNKIGPDGLLDGWYGHEAVSFTLAPGATQYVAFDENSQGSWGAAEGSSLPVDAYGGYDCTWGEFDFGNTNNDGFSGFDVSIIQAQAAGVTVQGMKICTEDDSTCSTITADAADVVNAYTKAEADIGGIGGNLAAGAVRLVAYLDYDN